MSRLVVTSLICLFAWTSLDADDWPQWMGPKRDGIWRESGMLRTFGAEGPKVSWTAKVAGGYAGPAVAAGRVFVTDYVVKEGDTAPSPNDRNVLKGTERIWCLDEDTGREIWKHEYDRPYEISYPAGPRATPTVDGDRVYVLGAEGDLICLRVDDGDVIWSRNLPTEYQAETPIWGYSAHPLIIGEQLICLAGGEGSAVVSLNKRTGKELWRSLTTTNIGYAPPTLIQAGGTSQLLVWHATSLNSLDPSTGKPYWSHALEPDYQMSIAPPLQIGNLLCVGAIKNKSMGLMLAADAPAAEVLWRGSNRLGVGPSHCPLVADKNSDDHLYGVDRGALLCVQVSTGKRVWEDFSLTTNKRRANAGTAFIIRNEDVYFIWNETAELIVADLSPAGFKQISRSKPLLKPTHNAFGRDVVWSPPAFANGAMLVRNDDELIRVSLRR